MEILCIYEQWKFFVFMSTCERKNNRNGNIFTDSDILRILRDPLNKVTDEENNKSAEEQGKGTEERIVY